MIDTARVVLDASALLALLHREPGAQVVKQVLSTSVISSVNWSEVAQKSIARGLPVEPLRADLVEVGLDILNFTAEEAEMAADLYQATRGFGLSLGDRACLALAQRLGAPALTADRRWAGLHLTVEVRLIR